MPRKMLIVEDSTLQHKMYKTVFAPDREIKMVFALNGLEAMDKLALEKDIELIILDINMPKMNGLELLQKVKSDGAYATIPVIMLTTEGQDEDKDKAVALGASAYVVKPFKPSQLLKLLEEVLPGS